MRFVPQSSSTQTIAAVLALALLGACGSRADNGATTEADPASDAALNDQIMVDPDLANQNEGSGALTGAGERSIPVADRSPQAIAAAKREAAALVGGEGALRPVPAAREVAGEIPESATLSAASRAALSPGGANCGDGVQYSAGWAARLPEALPVYPRAATQEAAGNDTGGCSLRVINFITPVSLPDVLAFYHARAKGAGYSAEHLRKDGDNILSGTKGGAAYVVYGRTVAGGLTEVDLVTSGR